jgi:hypothetical protein
MIDGYKYEATSLVGFLQRMATHLLPHRYWVFTQGVVPEGKAPAALDAKLIAKYDVAESEGARRWRNSQGLGNVQYVRSGRQRMLLATHGDVCVLTQDSVDSSIEPDTIEAK